MTAPTRPGGGQQTEATVRRLVLGDCGHWWTEIAPFGMLRIEGARVFCPNALHGGARSEIVMVLPDPRP